MNQPNANETRPWDRTKGVLELFQREVRGVRGSLRILNEMTDPMTMKLKESGGSKEFTSSSEFILFVC